MKVSSSNRAAKATPSTTAQPEQAEPEQAEQPEQGAPSQPAAPAPAEASPEDSPAQAATTAPAAEETTAPDVPADEGSEAGTAGGLDPESTDQRDALNAAFEGNLPEAASRYDQLAKSSGAPVFSLAARLAREQAVRKP